MYPPVAIVASLTLARAGLTVPFVPAVVALLAAFELEAPSPTLTPGFGVPALISFLVNLTALL
jgi:hypothetical protein